jgi:Flp pilus assembly protein TadB
MLFLLSPGYVRPLVFTSLGHVLLVAAAVLLLMGMLVIRSISHVKL